MGVWLPSVRGDGPRRWVPGRPGGSVLLRTALRAALVVLLFVGFSADLQAQDLRGGYFVHQFWVELEPMAGGPLSNPGPNAPAGSGGSQGSTSNPLAPLSQNQAVTEILKEAQYVFSGMIYGFSFSYTPSDAGRGIAGSFELKPVAQIKWGDPHLKVLNTRVEGDRFIARVMYSLVPFQEVWTKGWDSNVYPSATGRGESRYFLSYAQKLASYEDAVKEAIRNYLSQRIYNKPRRIVGQLVLRGGPYTIIDAGKYVTTLTVKLRIDKIEPYTVF